MGKSTVARFFREAGIPVHDSDASVHALYRGEAVPLIEAKFQSVNENGVINREKLGQIVLNNPEKLQILESIIHPLVRQNQADFIATCRVQAKRFCVLEIPLLFETNAQQRCDAIVVVSAPEKNQRTRVLARPNMTIERFNTILKKQWPDARKRQFSHFIVETSGSFEATKKQTRAILRALSHQG
jgi:dephospho-CoA kinase